MNADARGCNRQLSASHSPSDFSQSAVKIQNWYEKTPSQKLRAAIRVHLPFLYPTFFSLHPEGLKKNEKTPSQKLRVSIRVHVPFLSPTFFSQAVVG